ncbi:MAG: 3'(2'),5'-bisphosphate nucleotidase CysQ [Woeseia sp.]|nr:3'(2'),5'-bisphosphate nucleotidase CysQ [Woeseia sp.]MBT8097892.1 3'(2'),5'-bisphosphate nucleotidase CysQ [Woeseia sp.]NNE59911.1 3'(2'),5'-bisphosphate nucleotidase CysQ [Woeseia sp.]NNL54276.1 3'(2'),5'-bisphosphate nucleotidase CysQ [Woeseia sp.]
MTINLKKLLEPIVELSQIAGAAILEVYQTDFAVEDKADDSPLTKADLAAHNIISKALRSLTPDLPLISEEGGLADFNERKRWERYWLIDPLDGTREFVKRNGEFTVNIALIDNHRPVLGVVHAPVLDLTYAAAVGYGASRSESRGPAMPISVATTSAASPRIVGSRSHRGSSLDAFLAAVGEFELLPMGSSLKFCRVAEGAADLYPRMGPTSEWDTAAAQAVVEQAGGAVLCMDGKPLLYNTKKELLNPHFMVLGPRDRDWLALAAGAQDDDH